MNLFDAIQVFAILGGTVLGGSLGGSYGGWIGCALGSIGGLAVGAVMGHVPLFLMLSAEASRLSGLSSEELLVHLRSEHCRTPNLYLLERRRRGYDISTELPMVYSMLVSEDIGRRTAGWAAIVSAFPEVASTLPAYCPTSSQEGCRQASEPLRRKIDELEDAKS